MQINLELYRVFYIVAKTGSLTKAKQELFVSQPAVSQAITKLESLLGGKLFLRTSKGMELTREGVMMFEHIKCAFSEIAIAEKSFSQMRGVRFGEVKVSASDTLSKYVLPRYISRFRESNPDVNIHIFNRTSAETIALLKAGKADVGLISDANSIFDQQVKVTPCMTVQECLVCSPVFFEKTFKNNSVLTALELISLPLILLESKSSTRTAIEQTIKNNGGTVRTSFELCSIDLIMEYAKINMGIGCVTREFAKRELENGSLVELKTDFEFPKHTIAVVTLKDALLSFAAMQLIERLLH